MVPFLFLFAGLFLIFLEFYLPGGVMGTAGILMIITSIVIISMQNASMLYTAFFFVVSIIGVVLVIKGAMWHIKRTRKDQSIFLDSDQEGFRASSFDTTMIGKEGEALVDMRPGGRILIEGKKYQALSVSGYIPKGDQVAVIAGQGESLHVKRVNEGSS